MNLEIVWNGGNIIVMMEYLIILGLIYLIYSISINIKNNLKTNKKNVVWLNIIGLIIVIVYLMKNLFEILNNVA